MPGSLWDLNSQARDRTHIHCIGRWILNHWTIREHPVITVFSKHITQTAQVIQGTRWESPCVFQWGLIFSIMFLCNWLLKLKGEILCLSVWLCVCVCVCVREREDEGIPGNLWSSAPAKQTWDSAHTCEIWMFFVPWESHSAWLIQAELPAASFQDAVQTRILMEITAGRRSDLREGGGCQAGSLASWWDLSIHDLEPLIWKQYVMQGGSSLGCLELVYIRSPGCSSHTFLGDWQAHIFFFPVHIKLRLLQSDPTAQFDWDRFTSTILTFYYLSPSKWKWKSLSHVWLFVTPWTIQSMKFSRPEY